MIIQTRRRRGRLERWCSASWWGHLRDGWWRTRGLLPPAGRRAGGDIDGGRSEEFVGGEEQVGPVGAALGQEEHLGTAQGQDPHEVGLNVAGEDASHGGAGDDTFVDEVFSDVGAAFFAGDKSVAHIFEARALGANDGLRE